MRVKQELSAISEEPIEPRCLLCLSSNSVESVECVRVPGSSSNFAIVDEREAGDVEGQCSRTRWYSRFILRKLLDIPKEQCDFTDGDTGTQICLCEACVKLVTEALELHQNILILTRKLEAIQSQVRATLGQRLTGKGISGGCCFDQDIWKFFQAGIWNTNVAKETARIPSPNVIPNENSPGSPPAGGSTSPGFGEEVEDLNDDPCEDDDVKPEVGSEDDDVKPEVGSEDDDVKPEVGSEDDDVKPEVGSEDDDVKPEVGSEDDMVEAADVWEQNDDDEESWKPDEGSPSDSEKSMSEISEHSDPLSDTDSETEKKKRPKPPPGKRQKSQVSPSTKSESTPKTPRKRTRVSILPGKGGDKVPSQKQLLRHKIKALDQTNPDPVLQPVQEFKFVCDKCDFKTNHPTHGYYHRRTHKVTDNFENIDGGTWIRCKLCGFEGNKGQCYKHMRDAHSLAARKYTSKPFHCDICNKTLLTVGGLKFHIQQVHEKLPKYTCEKCGKGFIRKAPFDDHTAMHENNEVGIHVCKDCGAHFEQLGNLRAHDKIYHRFQRLQSLKESEGITSKVEMTYGSKAPKTLKAVTCKFCGESFLSQSLRLEHQKARHLDQFISCQYCDAIFLHKSMVTRHIKSKHKTEVAKNDGRLNSHYKGLTCLQCNQHFPRASLTLEHQRTAHRDLFKKCELCDAIYMSRGAMRHHLKKEHGIVEEKPKPSGTTPKKKRVRTKLQQL